MKKRNPFLAALATFITPGLGQLYNGKLKKFAWAYALCMAFVGFTLISPLSSSLFWLITIAACNAIILALLLFDAFRDARKQKEFVQRRYNRWYVYLGIILIHALVIVPIAEQLLFSSVKAFRIPTGSMEPTLSIGDHVIVNMKAYKTADPQRGDLAVFKYPNNKAVPYLKRVIALPGEKIEIVERKVYVNDHPLGEPYAKYIDPGSMLEHFGPFLIPQGRYFLLGDNRDNSQDSRFWGPVIRDDFMGRAAYLYWADNKSRIGLQVK